ncbi:hypothetical protein PVAG01_07817 [Phlyctema vagabunda]|uniref:Cytochrome b5 heme-binding domain-containing protein n=1 Tax=Phlyctema vagabunda TaxID=108571 RepID=A0ABR4PEB6_9HELO
MLLGLSILIASVSFLCYRHPPASWSFLPWLKRPEIQDAPGRSAPEVVVKVQNDAAVAEENAISVIGDYLKDLGMAEGDGSEDEDEDVDRKQNESTPARAESDRKAMPPPSVFKKPSLPQKSVTPSFKVEASQPDQSVPSFPAINSAQRASGGRGPPSVSSRLNPQPPLRSPTSSLSPLPNRSPNSSMSAALAPPPTHSAIPSKPSKKVLLTPGHSPLDWARLAANPAVNLRGLPASTPYLRVPPSLLRQMTGRKGKDAWTTLGGKVYNITPYLPYHPGGEPELMKCAGRDGTRLFGEVHPWVNWEGMLEGCLVGIAVGETETASMGAGTLEEMD